MRQMMDLGRLLGLMPGPSGDVCIPKTLSVLMGEGIA
jgi:hypothetical protein